MLYNALLSLTAFMFCLSLFLVHRARVLENDFRKLQGDIILQLNQPCSEGVDGKLAKMLKTSEDIKSRVFQEAHSSLKISSRRVKRDPGSSRASTAFLQLRADTNKRPDIRGNITVISWIVSAQRGTAISQKENRIVVQEDGYYLVFGQVLCHSNSSRTKLIMHMICSNQLGNVLLNLQVLFESPSIVMGHVVRSRASAEAELLRCLQAMPDRYPANTCYTAGTVQLLQDDELELVIPDRPTALISTDEDSTFFGVIQLN
uniref:tumor necrosis factor ligand superfamily member 13B isoform X1 n=1 Tax=Maylandia zebra TaxID=106582 RepID=UPI0006490DD1|nr:tumor necrosis factor ligand superfamily member 13B isoform X1 [Maylandia zebra]